jgi:ABC-2 type transport system permease protein
MRISPVVKKELASYFNSPIAYIVVVAYLVVTSAVLFLVNQFFIENQASLRGYFGFVPIVFIFLIPAITMRSWAEERKSGTLEILLTLPFREAEAVAGKFLAAMALLGCMMALSVPLPLSLGRFGSFDAGQIICQYLGTILVGACGISIGLLISSLSSNQISSYIFCGLALFAFTLTGQLNSVMSLPGWLAAGLRAVSFNFHFDSFAKGIIDTRDLAYFVILCAAFLFLNTQVLIRRKWS